LAVPLVAVAVLAGSGQAAPTHREATVSVFASGLNNPRGLEFGPDGNLYVAEGGLGGTLTTTPVQCDQVVPPVGPYSGDFTARISKIGPGGSAPTTVASGLPSSQTSPALGSLVSGVADVAFVGNTLYALLAGAGCSHGLLGTENAVVRVNTNGSTTMVADLSAFQKAHPVANPEPDDFEPDGTWYSMVAVGGALYAVEPNHGELDRIATNGSITRIADISASQGHVVPTALAYHGVFYLGNLGTFGPADATGDEQVYQVNPNGKVQVRASGLEQVLGLAFKGGELYALESSTTGGGPTPGTGQIVRVRAGAPAETVASGLTFPTAMTIGPDGAFYVSERGFGFGPGDGRILRISG